MEALNLAKSEAIDLIITDILTPTLDGFDLVNQLWANPELQKIPIIFYTATYLSKEARSLAKSCGARFALKDPSKPHLILKTVQKALGNTSPLITAKSTPLVKPISLRPLPAESLEIPQFNKMLSKRFSKIDSNRNTLKNFIKNSRDFAEEKNLPIEPAAKV